MLYLIGIGLGKHSITLEALEAIKNCNKIFLETYTSVFESSKEELELLLNKKITEADREFVESKITSIFKESKMEDIAFLTIGDIYSATTHVDIYLRAKKENIPIKIINGVSILTAVGIAGLSLYNFGKTVSIPFNHKEVNSTYNFYKNNKNIGLHTLFLLDLDPKNNKFLSVREACKYLLTKGEKKETMAIACARLGFENFKIKTGTLESLQREDFGKPPYCLIIPGNLHFIEEEALNLWK